MFYQSKFRRSIYLFALAFFLVLPLSAQNERGIQHAAKQLVDDDVIVGKMWAVFIAIDDYQRWLPLKNPVKDAYEIRDILNERYYVDEVIELINENATRRGITQLFSQLYQNVGPQDSVFIYYAGHGYLDELSGTGFWIPVDGGEDVFGQENWLSNSVIRGYLSNFRARIFFNYSK